jgi:hypothetical protein
VVNFDLPLLENSFFNFNPTLIGLKVATEKNNWVSTPTVAVAPGFNRPLFSPVNLSYLTGIFNFSVVTEARLAKIRVTVRNSDA